MNEDWIVLYQDAAGWLAQQNLTGEQFKVLHALFGKLDFNNYLRIGLKEIADFLGIQPKHVSRAMRRLKELKIVIKEPPAGKFKTTNSTKLFKAPVSYYSTFIFGFVLSPSCKPLKMHCRRFWSLYGAL